MNVVSFQPDDRLFVYAVVYKLVGPDDAEDVTQDALLLAYRARDSFRGDARYRTWLYRIAMTTALGHLRRRRRARVSLVANEEQARLFEHVEDPARSPEHQVGDAQQVELVGRALDQLPPTYRTVLLERVETPEPAVAAKLGISVANVKIRTHRARRQLAQRLAELDRAA
ncbi:MAG: sigma-70 family RNA polymerase sigma factor [Myxococcales bacterium]|nr:sigma-70 family RNA polymerase sigma factor [Myxococcales bacterium]